MAFNPMQLMMMKDRFKTFKHDHPKLLPFLKSLGSSAAEPGTVVTIQAVTPGGRVMKEEFTMTKNDVDTVRVFFK